MAHTVTLDKLRQVMAQSLAFCTGAIEDSILRDQGLGRFLSAPMAFSVLAEQGEKFQPIVKAMAVALLAAHGALDGLEPVLHPGLKIPLLAAGTGQLTLKQNEEIMGGASNL
jgi:hypothetical protein